MTNASTKAQRIIRERGLTYREIAEQIGISPQAVYAIATGRAEGATGRFAVAKVLGLEVADLWPTAAPTRRAA